MNRWLCVVAIHAFCILGFSITTSHAYAQKNQGQIERLIQQSRSANTRSRIFAAFTLSKMPRVDPKFVPILVDDLKDENKTVRFNAATVLANMSSDAAAAVPALCDATRDIDDEVRAKAVMALMNVGSHTPLAITALIAALKDKDLDVHGLAILALANSESQDPSVIRALISDLNDRNSDIRGASAFALRNISLQIGENANHMSAEELVASLGKLHEIRSALNAVAGKSDTDSSLFASFVASNAAAIEDIKRAQESYMPYRVKEFVAHNQAASAVIVYVVLMPLVCLLLLWFCPLALLYVNDGLKKVTKVGLPPPFNLAELAPGYLLGVGFLNYHHRVLDAWVAKYSKVARISLDESRSFRDRHIYVNTPLGFPEGEKLPKSHEFHTIFSGKSTIIVIWGDGGSGKTTLSCQLARWALADNEDERLCKTHRMMPVFIDENIPGAKPGDTLALLDAIGSFLKQVIREEAAPTNELIKKLLERRRILLIVDGYSELNNDTQQVIRPSAPALPINALLVTSRDKSSLDTANPLVLKTGLLKGQGIAAFIEDYIQMGDKRVLFSNSEFYDDLGQFTSLVGDREITALLAALYSRHMIDHKENTSTERPNNVPELMDTYIDEMCRKAHDNSYPIEIVAPLAYKIAWNCLQDTLTPTETSLDQMLTALSNTEDTIELPAGQSNPNTVITFFVEKLRLLRRHGSNQRSLKFALDPLSEYLAARYLVTYSCRGDEHKWYNFLDVAEQRFASGEPIADFLRALKDTLDAKKQEGSVPEFVLQELCRRFPFVRAASNSDIRA